ETNKWKEFVLNLVERISYEINTSNFWICGDMRTAEIWPWEGIVLSPQEILKLMRGQERDQGSLTPDARNEEEVWSLRSEVIGEECFWRRGPKFVSYVGESSCKRYLVTNGIHQWWLPQAKHLYWARKQKQGCSY
ncbi:ENR1 protein, partial [Leptocoma aspasia]|nr:ENR1 protein [Leptocoma aspasia]